MAEKPEDLTIRLLRDIRDKLSGMDELKSRMTRLEREVSTLAQGVWKIAGMSVQSDAKHDTADERPDEIEERLTKLEEKA